MTDHIQKLRDALDQAKVWLGFEGHQDEVKLAEEALASLTEIEKNYIPLDKLPEGVHFDSMRESFGGGYTAVLLNVKGLKHMARGKTPNEAFENAIKEVGR